MSRYCNAIGHAVEVLGIRRQQWLNVASDEPVDIDELEESGMAEAHDMAEITEQSLNVMSELRKQFAPEGYSFRVASNIAECLQRPVDNKFDNLPEAIGYATALGALTTNRVDVRLCDDNLAFASGELVYTVADSSRPMTTLAKDS